MLIQVPEIKIAVPYENKLGQLYSKRPHDFENALLRKVVRTANAYCVNRMNEVLLYLLRIGWKSAHVDLV